jgi:hypothetical protein
MSFREETKREHRSTITAKGGFGRPKSIIAKKGSHGPTGIIAEYSSWRQDKVSSLGRACKVTPCG